MHLFANLVGVQALALKEKKINPQGPRYVRLVGRKSGLLAWFLNICGIDMTTVLEIYADRIEYKHRSLSGSILEVIPLSKVSNLFCGYFKPVILLFGAIIFLFAWMFCFLYRDFCLSYIDFAVISVIAFIFSVVLAIYYFLQKSILLSIIPNSSSAIAIAFKRSLIENKNITEDEAQLIIQIVVNLVESANTPNKTTLSDTPKTKPRPPAQTAPIANIIPPAASAPKVTSSEIKQEERFIKTECPHCGQHYKVDVKYVDKITKCQTCDQEFVIEVIS